MKTKHRKTNVEYIKTNYFKSTPANKVVCELIWGLPVVKIPGVTNFPDDFLNIIDNTFRETYGSYLGIMFYNGDPYFAFKNTGSAVCADDDTYNETVGTRIALSKAQAKAFDTSVRVYTYLLDEYIKPDIMEMLDLIHNCKCVADDCDNHVNEIEIQYINTLK